MVMTSICNWTRNKPPEISLSIPAVYGNYWEQVFPMPSYSTRRFSPSSLHRGIQKLFWPMALI